MQAAPVGGPLRSTRDTPTPHHTTPKTDATRPRYGKWQWRGMRPIPSPVTCIIWVGGKQRYLTTHSAVYSVVYCFLLCDYLVVSIQTSVGYSDSTNCAHRQHHGVIHYYAS